MSPDLRSTEDTFASINFLHDRVRSPHQVRLQPCTGPHLHKAGKLHSDARLRRPSSCVINDRVVSPNTTEASRHRKGSHAAWREASSRVASPRPQLEWPTFLNGTGTAKHLERRRNTTRTP
ncbi:hypothetical protein MRX96_058803 [Rhipicephalus microplus]